MPLNFSRTAIFCFLSVYNASRLTATVTAPPWPEVGHTVYSSTSHELCVVNTRDMIKIETDGAQYPGVTAHLEASQINTALANSRPAGQRFTPSVHLLKHSAVQMAACHSAFKYLVSHLRFVIYNVHKQPVVEDKFKYFTSVKVPRQQRTVGRTVWLKWS